MKTHDVTPSQTHVVVHSLAVVILFVSLPIACVEQSISDSDAALDNSQITIIVFMFGVFTFCCLIIVIFCSQCWPMKYFQRSTSQFTDLENSAQSECDHSGRGSGEMVQMNVRELELDPVVFEPLPTLADIESCELTTKTPSGKRNRSRIRYLPTDSPALVPLDSHIYAHDWFDESFTNFSRGNLEYVKEIGTGWFGKVIEAYAKDIVPYARKIQVVVKVLRDDASGLDQMRFLDEARLYRDSNHGNILRLLGHSIETCPFLLILEHCPQGNLKSYLISNVNRAELLNRRGDVVRICLDLARALSWMWSADFVHGDLAARNCLVSHEDRVIIGDYGLSTSLFKDDYYWSSNGVVIPLRWAAPESIHCTMNTIQTLKVTKLSNVWSFGVLLWEVATFCKQPYYELNDDEVMARVICDKNYILGAPPMVLTMTGVRGQGQRLYDIMKRCWNPMPSQRPTMAILVTELECIYKEIQNSISNSRSDDFDSKWELFSSNTSGRLGSSLVNNSSGVQSAAGKKSVRFAEGFNEEEGSEQRVSSITTTAQPEDVSMTMTEVIEEKTELNEVSEKVREKSRNFQNLMILTHVEPSDLEDSLPIDDSTNSKDLSDSMDNERVKWQSESQPEPPVPHCSNSSSDSAIVVFGASDELGIDYYQQFTSEILDTSFNPSDRSQVEQEDMQTNNSDNKILQVEKSDVSDMENEIDQEFLMKQMNSIKDATSDVLEMCKLELRSEGTPEMESTQISSESGQPVSSQFVPSTWNQTLVPNRPALKSPVFTDNSNSQMKQMSPSSLEFPATISSTSNLKKSVSFDSEKTHRVYEYPPPPPASDSEEEEKHSVRGRTHFAGHPQISNRLALSMTSLDWDMQPEPADDCNTTKPECSQNSDSDDTHFTVGSKSKIDFYRLAPFDPSPESSPSKSGEHVQQEPESEPNVVLGELRYKREKLKLDLGHHESFETKTEPSNHSQCGGGGDSGMGSCSTNDSPFNQ